MKTTMASVLYEIVPCLLLLTAIKATNAQPKRSISISAAVARSTSGRPNGDWRQG